MGQDLTTDILKVVNIIVASGGGEGHARMPQAAPGGGHSGGFSEVHALFDQADAAGALFGDFSARLALLADAIAYACNTPREAKVVTQEVPLFFGARALLFQAGTKGSRFYIEGALHTPGDGEKFAHSPEKYVVHLFTDALSGVEPVYDLTVFDIAKWDVHFGHKKRRKGYEAVPETPQELPLRWHLQGIVQYSSPLDQIDIDGYETEGDYDGYGAVTRRDRRTRYFPSKGLPEQAFAEWISRVVRGMKSEETARLKQRLSDIHAGRAPYPQSRSVESWRSRWARSVLEAVIPASITQRIGFGRPAALPGRSTKALPKPDDKIR
jgi:hypothetical protein